MEGLQTERLNPVTAEFACARAEAWFRTDRVTPVKSIAMKDTVLSLDFGGTKLAAGLVRLGSGDVVAAARCPTPGDASAGYAAMLGMARELLTQSAEPVCAVGVSFGGPVEADGRTVRRSMHVPGWEAMPLANRLEADLALPATIANDADAAALAEQRYGAGRAIAHLLYLTVSTGIGGGIVIDGKIHRGARAWAGEIGHQVLDPDGPPCDCGRNGCLEALASGRAVARAAQAILAHAGTVDSLLRRHATITARDVTAAATAGDPAAQAVWGAAMTWLGIGIANAANILNPTRVIIGGGLTNAGPLLFEPVRQTVARRALDPDLEIVPAALGEHVGLPAGAAVTPAEMV